MEINMISIDQSAYRSGLRKTDPLIKLVTALTVLFTGLLANSYLVSAIIIAVMSWAAVQYGGAPLKTYVRLIRLPLSFLLISVITILLQRAEDTRNLVLHIKIFGSYFGFAKTSVWFAAGLLLKAVAAVSCMYFLALTTPMTEFFRALRRLRFPKLAVELMELIYRFIFVLTDTANQIYVAQSSRLGYCGLRAAYKSLGVLVSMLFVRAYKRSDRIYTALDSRGYDGELHTMDIMYPHNVTYYLVSGIFIFVLIAIALLEGVVAK
jgi:cobalt/nickel transport system permease protein